MNKMRILNTYEGKIGSAALYSLIISNAFKICLGQGLSDDE